MKWTMSLGFAIAMAGCGYGQTKMVATTPPTSAGSNYAAAAPAPPPPPAPVTTDSTTAPTESDLPPDHSPALDSLPAAPLAPLPDRAMPPPIVPSVNP